MNIKVIGAGAMGSLFGALLAEAGETVTLLDIRRDHVDAVNARGLSIEKAGARRIVRLQATTGMNGPGPAADLSIVFVKSTHTAAAAETAARLSGKNGSRADPAKRHGQCGHAGPHPFPGPGDCRNDIPRRHLSGAGCHPPCRLGGDGDRRLVNDGSLGCRQAGRGVQQGRDRHPGRVRCSHPAVGQALYQCGH